MIFKEFDVYITYILGWNGWIYSKDKISRRKYCTKGRFRINKLLNEDKFACGDKNVRTKFCDEGH